MPRGHEKLSDIIANGVRTVIEAILDWPPIIQGALGSILAWVVVWAIGKLASTVSKAARTSAGRRLIREYVYTKYTSHDGLFYRIQGYMVTFSAVLRDIVLGLTFVAIALLTGWFSPVVQGVAIIGAIAFLFHGLVWLVSSSSWNWTSGVHKWERIRDLETALFGKVSDDTLEFLEKQRYKEEQD